MIKFDHVSFSYDVTDADGNAVSKDGIFDLDLTIENGEFIVLTGGSGCGKTTLTRMINGLIPHYYKGTMTGTVTIEGKSVSDMPIYDTSKMVGSVFQNPRSQFFNVNTTDEIAFASENQSRDPMEIMRSIEETASSMKIKKLLDRNIFELSGGEKQIIACAGIDVLSPDIVVLDEPSSNLDFYAIEKLRSVLHRWKREGKTIVIAEHRLFFLRELADRLLIMADGKIIQDLDRQQIEKLNCSDTEKMGIRPLCLDDLKADFQKRQTSESTLVLEKFCFSYGNSKHGINIPELTLPTKSIIAVIGHNGAGKSTLARNICGLEKKCKGFMHFEGRQMKTKDRLRSCYMIMQDVNHQLFAESVKEETILSMTEKSLSDTEKEQKALSVLSQLDLSEFAELHPMALSGGQKQRTAIASGIASEKPVMLFDEPTSGLDLVHMQQVAKELIELRESGKTIIVVTHDLELILLCCDHILHMEQGIVQENYDLDNDSVSKLMAFFQS
ncbi:MAG: ABC transporter ATP-binding protein [Ruminococcus sp.]|uniref:ABC transporter ATP-binding protein n=1 Tax=Ruminococcus sp. TaxID=41978 RepID=UPI0025DE5508|nr:ABC transporter ATP-binding protein [Ruminococcus sp.]MCR5540503.1 ABC transporter ATP-binding protein [Ruminococcus sp.]